MADFDRTDGERVDSEGILQVATSVDGVVESHPIHHQENAVRLESTKDGDRPADSADHHLTRIQKQRRRIRGHLPGNGRGGQ